MLSHYYESAGRHEDAQAIVREIVSEEPEITAELAFEMPRIKREMVVVIQGLVILFSGALEFMLAPYIEALFRRRRPARAADS